MAMEQSSLEILVCLLVFLIRVTGDVQEIHLWGRPVGISFKFICFMIMNVYLIVTYALFLFNLDSKLKYLTIKIFNSLVVLLKINYHYYLLKLKKKFNYKNTYVLAFSASIPSSNFK